MTSRQRRQQESMALYIQGETPCDWRKYKRVYNGPNKS